MSIHTMPNANDPKLVDRLVLTPEMHTSRFSPSFGRMLWTCSVYNKLFEGAVHTTRVAFTAGGAAMLAELWMRDNGYTVGSRIGRDTTLG